VAYTQERKSKTKGTRYVGYYLDAAGKPRVAGTFDTDEKALSVAQEQEDHERGGRAGTPPAEKAKITIEEFAKTRFLPRIDITPKGKQTYKSHLKNHVYPYLGRERVAEISREQLYTHLVTTLPEAEATLVTRRAVRTVLSSMLQMAWDEGYRDENPVMTIKLKSSPTKPVLVSTHGQWNRLEEALPFPAALLYARLNVTTWARQCEMRTLRPCDFEFGSTTMINITRSASYVTSDNHPDGHAGVGRPAERQERRLAAVRDLRLDGRDDPRAHLGASAWRGGSAVPAVDVRVPQAQHGSDGRGGRGDAASAGQRVREDPRARDHGCQVHHELPLRSLQGLRGVVRAGTPGQGAHGQPAARRAGECVAAGRVGVPLRRGVGADLACRVQDGWSPPRVHSVQRAAYRDFLGGGEGDRPRADPAAGRAWQP
jgi:hypothetical protein